MNTKLPWRITEPNEKKTREIVANDGTTIAKLTKLDLEMAGFIVAACNAHQSRTFDDGIKCAFDYLQSTAMNTDDGKKFRILMDIAEDIIDYSPEFSCKWEEIKKINADWSAKIAEKDAEILSLRTHLDKFQSLVKAQNSLIEMKDKHIERCKRLGLDDESRCPRTNPPEPSMPHKDAAS